MRQNTRSRRWPRLRPLGRKERRSLWTALLFLSPWLVGFLVFTLYPMVASLIYSLTNFNGLVSTRVAWYSNYAELFQDPKFWKSLGNTAYMVLFSVVITLFFSFICALLLNFKVRGQSIYRVLFYLPSIIPTVASTMLWIWILKPDNGVLSALLGLFGLESPNWFLDPNWSKPALILLGLWGTGGTIVIYLAGLQEVPQSLLEAAELDGAGWWQRLRHITIPMVSPITLFNLITGVIGTFQYFSQAYVFAKFASVGKASITLGAPLQSTLFYSVYLYQRFFEFRWGYASAMAWILFLIILVCTLLLLRVSRDSTYYAG